MGRRELPLRYGINPHQTPARVLGIDGDLPFSVLNGAPGYVNLLDALNSWQLVRELRRVSGAPAAASFKHVSPSGAALAEPLDDTLRRAYSVDDLELSPLATAYARARGADRLSSFGDWVALSDTVDLPTARLLRREVSDGIIAPDFEPEALSMLAGKRGGKYVVVKMDAAYEPDPTERRDVFGIQFEQARNTSLHAPDTFSRIVSRETDLPEGARRDMLVALVTLKYTQSNSVCLVRGGQTIGIGAGQQSRIHCTRLAAAKADTWFLRQHPDVLGLPFRNGISRPDRDNAIDQYLRDDLTPAEEVAWLRAFERRPERLAPDAKRAWLDRLDGVTYASEAFLPFRDNLDRAARSGVRYVVQPGGSTRDDSVVEAADDYGMVMAFSGVRLFHH